MFQCCDLDPRSVGHVSLRTNRVFQNLSSRTGASVTVQYLSDSTMGFSAEFQLERRGEIRSCFFSRKKAILAAKTKFFSGWLAELAAPCGAWRTCGAR